MRFLNAYNKLTRAEVGILLLLLLSTFRICLLPAVLSQVAGESCVYVMLSGLAIDLVICVAALRVAGMGGIGGLRLHPVVRRIFCGVLAFFFFFKVTVHVYEAVAYCVNDLFEQASPLLLMVVFVLTSAFLAHKGFAGIARTGIMFMLVIVFLAVLSVFFAAFGGYGYNLWVLLRPHDVGKGLLQSMLWLGDGAIFFLADTRTSVHPERHFRWGILAFAVVAVGMLFFYLNFVFTYGSAGQYVRFAFVRMLTNGDPEELGAVDWPIMLIWLVSVPLAVATHLYAGCEGLRQCVSRREHGGLPFLVVGTIAVMVAYYLMFPNGDGWRHLVESTAVAYTLVGVLGLCAVVAIVAAFWGRPKGQEVRQ